MRLGKKGNYRRYGELYKLEKSDEYNPIFSDTPVTFRFKYSNGEGLQKEEYKLFSNWVMQSRRVAVETNAIESFEKGDKIIIDGETYMLQRIIEKIDPVILNGRKKIVNKRTVLFGE